MVEIDRRKAALIAELEVSRGEIRRSIRACGENLDVVSVLRKSVRGNLKVWLPGAALGGWVASKLLSLQLGRPRAPREAPTRGSGETPRSGGWFATLLRVALDLMRPALMSCATEWLARKASQFSAAAVAGVQAAEPRTPETERQAHTRNGIY
jgi:hypothetical protein